MLDYAIMYYQLVAAQAKAVELLNQATDELAKANKITETMLLQRMHSSQAPIAPLKEKE